MTTITSKFTKERLIDWAVVAVAERGRDLKDAPESVEAAANLKLAEIALAALTAEPVRYLNKFSGTCVTLERQSNAADDVAVYIPLYAAPPAPVVPEECPAELPYAQVKAVADLFALCWKPGDVVTYTPDPEKATIWLNNYSGTSVQEYVNLERLQEDTKHGLLEVAIARFSKMNEGFPIKRFKADWVISWMLENFPPVAQKQGDN
ncbi:TPA: hypothetical protein ACXISN_004496 [Salmonella enterica subsp. enterica serovar Horsham]